MVLRQELLKSTPVPEVSQGRKPVKVLWLQVCALAGVQASIGVAWVIYNLYLANLLQGFGFAPGAATMVVLLANLLAAVVEPIAGGLADLSQRWLGSRFPVIAVGVVLSSALFVLIPLLWLLGSWGQEVTWLRPGLPLILVLWALAMSLFRGPVLSLLGNYALNRRLPQAASFLTLTEGFARGWGFVASGWILGLGPVFAFGIGSTILLIGAIVLLLSDPDVQVERNPRPSPPSPLILPKPTDPQVPDPKAQNPLTLSKLGWLLGAGMGATLGFRLLFMGFSQALQRLSLAGTQSSLILGILFLSMSLVALPLGNLQVRLGHQRGLLLGLTLMAGLGTIVPWISSPGLAVLMAILLGLTLGMISNSAVPFALTLVPLEWASLGTTIYFSGGSIAAALLAGTLASLQAFHPAIATLLGSGGCLLAGFFVASAMPLRQPKK
jgi:hypothetical protein